MSDLLAHVIAFMLVCALIAGIGYVYGAIPCESKAKRMGLRHSYELLEGCMVKVDDRWVPLEAYRVID